MFSCQTFHNDHEFLPLPGAHNTPSPHDLNVHLFCQVECYIPCLVVQQKERDENKQQQLLIHTCRRCFLAPHTAKVNEGGIGIIFGFAVSIRPNALLVNQGEPLPPPTPPGPQGVALIFQGNIKDKLRKSKKVSTRFVYVLRGTWQVFSVVSDQMQ